jgi:hypothetical protein
MNAAIMLGDMALHFLFPFFSRIISFLEAIAKSE